MEIKIKKKLIIIITITLVLAIAFMGVMVKMISENGKCVDDPFGYSATRLKDSGGNYSCSCQSLDQELLDFRFSEEGIEIITPDDFNIKSFSGPIQPGTDEQTFRETGKSIRR